jgi:hypothetical protein
VHDDDDDDDDDVEKDGYLTLRSSDERVNDDEPDDDTRFT